MNNNQFESKMRSLEYFHDIKILSDLWIIIRVDGRSFSKFTNQFEKPFDERFHNLMLATTETLIIELGGIYAYTESDEISIFLPKNTEFFNRSLEKLVSISAAIASSAFTLQFQEERVSFDSRIWISAKDSDVIDYFNWRQSDATRCALNGYCYWTLRKNGESSSKATSILNKQTVEFKNNLLFENGINFNELPLWQRRGSGMYWHEYEKLGYNPKADTNDSLGKLEVAIRKKLVINKELPMKELYSDFIGEF